LIVKLWLIRRILATNRRALGIHLRSRRKNPRKTTDVPLTAKNVVVILKITAKSDLYWEGILGCALTVAVIGIFWQIFPSKGPRTEVIVSPPLPAFKGGA